MSEWSRTSIGFITALGLGATVYAQESHQPASVALTVEAGRPLRVALSERVRIERAGQRLVGVLVDPLYAYDRIVVPAGAVVHGHIERFDEPSRFLRAQALASGDFSPQHRAVVQFDEITLDDDRLVPIRAPVTSAAERMTLSVASGADETDQAGDAKDGGIGRRAREKAEELKNAARQKAADALAVVRGPDKLERIKAGLIDRLPYHPQYIAKGTVYTAELLEPLEFGAAPAAALAASDERPAPRSILNARLVTPLDSARTPRGSRIEAIVTEPVFSAGKALLLPVGSRLIGEVTFATAARHFHRNGTLRLLFESVQLPGSAATPMLASLYSAQLDRAAAVDLDEEGGAHISDSKSRFVAPALALLSLRSLTRREARPLDNDADDTLGPRPGGNPATLGIGGFLGWGTAGAAVSQLWHPVGIALTSVGVARTVYGAFLAKGREAAFPADTVIQVELAPGPSVNR
jgi:hypothetical protein